MYDSVSRFFSNIARKVPYRAIYTGYVRSASDAVIRERFFMKPYAHLSQIAVFPLINRRLFYELEYQQKES